MQGNNDIYVNHENSKHVIDISSQPQMSQRDQSVHLHSSNSPFGGGGGGGSGGRAPAPNLNVHDSMPFGMDLLINPGKRTGSDGSSVVSGSGASDAGGNDYGYGGGGGVVSGSESASEDAAFSETMSNNGGYGGNNGNRNNMDNQWQQQQQQQRAIQSEEEILNQKREILYQFDRLERKGVRLPRRFTLSSSLDEMRTELNKIIRERKVDESIKFQRSILVTTATGIEMLSARFNPLGARLDGWSESVNEDIDKYDDVFEELHTKYAGKSQMAPELRLLMMLGGSAFMFHLTNAMFKSSAMPGMEQVLKQNPDLAKQFAAATANSMHQSGADPIGLGKMFTGMFGQQQAPAQQQQQPQQQQRSRPTMRGPSNIDNLLQDLDRPDLSDRLETMSTLTESEMSDLPDDASINGLISKGGKARGGANNGRRTLNLFGN